MWDVVAQLTRIQGWKPDLLLVSAVGKSPVMVTKNFNQLGFAIPIMYSHSNASPFFLELLGSEYRQKPRYYFPGLAIHIWDLPDSYPQKAVCKAVTERNRGWLAGRDVLANLVSSPGAGKTTLLERTILDLGGVVVPGARGRPGDSQRMRSTRIQATGCRVVQVNTGVGCHLDAAMVVRDCNCSIRPLSQLS